MVEKGVALGGFMGTGKSTVGRLLARSLHMPFLDTDQELVKRHGPIREQFTREGEAVFRTRERTLIDEVVAGPPRVLSTGGGVFADDALRSKLADWGHTVTLTASWGTLRSRVGDDPDRPLWDERVRSLWEARRAAYADVDRVVDTDALDPEGVVREVLAWLR